MKANHNHIRDIVLLGSAVLAVSKVLNLKANHNASSPMWRKSYAVLAVSKVLNLKANHNMGAVFLFVAVLY